VPVTIPDEEIAQVRARTDLASLIGEYTALKRVGRRQVGLCPFHSEATPSFSVNAEEGLYHCFGCQASGDAITFLRAMEGCDFIEAVERLAGRAGITVHNEQGDGARDDRRRLYQAVAAAASYYHDLLLHDQSAGPARHYLRSRGYDGEIVRRFQLGWAPPGWDSLVRALDLPRSVLESAGLAHVNSSGRLQDGFRSRVIFPIFDPSGRPIAFGGRVLPDSDAPHPGQDARGPGGTRRGTGGAGPKYRNSPETAIYRKRQTLYGLNYAKAQAVQTGEIVVCEGYTDVIGCFSAGVGRAVATCGTALTDDHFRLLSRYAQRVVLAFDADSAGQAATERIYEFEQRHHLEVVVANLPEGSDPAELARDDPAGLCQAVAEARPLLQFEMMRTLSRADLSSIEGRARAASIALAVVAEHPDRTVRDQYLLEIADRLRLDPGTLRPRLEELRRGHTSPAARPSASRSASGSSTPALSERQTTRSAPEGQARERATEGTRSAPSPSRPASPADSRLPGEPEPGRRADRYSSGESTGDLVPPVSPPPQRSGQARGRADPSMRAGHEALLLAVHRPEEMAPWLHEVLFSHELHRAAFRALTGAASLSEAIESAPESVATLLTELAVSEPRADPHQSVLALVRSAASAGLSILEAESRLAAAEGDLAKLAAVASASAWLKSTLEQIRDPGVGDTPPAILEAAAALLAFLIRQQDEQR